MIDIRTSVWRRVLTSAVLLGLVVALGCSDDEPQDMTGPESGPITVAQIIITPGSPDPGDTVVVTSVTTGTSAPGDFVNYAWSADGGTFLDNGLTSVRWVAPMNSTTYTISVTASNSVSTSSLSYTLFVGTRTPLFSDAGEFHVTSTGDSIYYLSSTLAPDDADFDGFQIRLWDGADQAVNMRDGFEYAFNRYLTHAAHAEVRPDDVQQLFFDDLVTGSVTPIATTPVIQSEPEFGNPQLSPDGNIIAYEAYLPDQFRTGPAVRDTFQVFVYDVAAAQVGRVVRLVQAFRPMISPDGNYLLYLTDGSVASDRQGTNDYEFYSLPIVGGQVVRDTDMTPLQLTSSGGVMAGGRPASVGVFSWNPAQPLLAIIDRSPDERPWLIPADGTAPILATVLRSRDIAWAPDGSKLGVATAAEVYSVDLSGNATLIHTPPAGDALSQLAWSPDGNWLLYSVARGTDSWYEIKDIGGVSGLTAPIRITSSRAGVGASNYIEESDYRPRWHPTLPLVYVPLIDFETPTVASVDLSGAMP